MKKWPAGRVVFCVLGSLGLLPGLTSCASGKRLHPVRGTVFVNSKPAEGALVVFHAADDADPAAPQPRGYVQADGSFTLSTHEKDDGAAAGEYIVTINWLDTAQRKGEDVPDRLKGDYTSRQTSTLRRRVEPGNNDFPFTLKE